MKLGIYYESFNVIYKGMNNKIKKDLLNNERKQNNLLNLISKEYKISQEAIVAEVNKLIFKQSEGSKKLEKRVTTMRKQNEENTSIASPEIVKRENMVIYLLINEPEKTYAKLNSIINTEDFKHELNKQILKKLYEELEKGNINTNHILDWFEEEKMVNHITEIMAGDFEIADINKALDDLVSIYEKEKLIYKRNELIKKLESISDLSKEQAKQYENELNDVILKLAKIK